MEDLMAQTASAPLRVVITGVSRGIGRATAIAYAAQGAHVAGLHRDADPAVSHELSEAIRAAGGQPMIRVGDTRSTANVDALADEAAEAWGGLDVWVNNAARLLVQPFLTMTDEDWTTLLDSNLFGYVRGARAAARHMVPARSGTIVNISSAVDPFPPTDMTGYVTAKGGIAGFTRALAVELGPHGVRVNAVSPGATETPLNDQSWTDEVRATYRERIPLRRIATADEIADAIVMIGSNASRYITGQVILADGGLTLNGSVGHRRN
jgi:NAD(P)-dependent dehydrogenase (short-subunit alcohol dehydrogenase family)